MSAKVFAATTAVPRCARPGCFASRKSTRVLAESKSQSDAPPEMSKEQQEAMEKAMKDPEVQKRMEAMQEQLKNPAVQQQMAEMQGMMANPEMQKRLSQLQDDPELKGMFEEIQKGGMGALMKFWNDPNALAKLGRKVGDVPVPAGAAGAAGAAAGAPAAPEVNDLLDAARVGDQEAAEDFVAIGKDVNTQDAEGRSPLHYAVAKNFTGIISCLLGAGANVEVQDSKQNTPLHYAAGYGNVDAVDLLLDAGADVSVKNHTGKLAADLAALNERNPVLLDAGLMERLKVAA